MANLGCVYVRGHYSYVIGVCLCSFCFSVHTLLPVVALGQVAYLSRSNSFLLSATRLSVSWSTFSACPRFSLVFLFSMLFLSGLIPTILLSIACMTTAETREKEQHPLVHEPTSHTHADIAHMACAHVDQATSTCAQLEPCFLMLPAYCQEAAGTEEGDGCVAKSNYIAQR